MRHGVKGKKLSRTASHRAATYNALATSLILHKKIRTTEAKAKAMRSFIEPILTRAKLAIAQNGDAATVAAGLVHARRVVATQIKDRAAVKTLFSEIAPKIATRPGGYTRVIKLGNRHGDNAAMAVLELVDWTNEAGTTAAPRATAAKARPTRNKEKTAEATLAAAEAPKKPRATRKKKTEAEA